MIDAGLERYIKMMLKECSDNYGLDTSTSSGLTMGIVYTYNKLHSMMPFEGAILRRLIIMCIGEVVGIKERSVRLRLDTNDLRYKRAEYITRAWKTNIWDVGTFHYVRSVNWYTKQGYLLRGSGVLKKDSTWKKDRYAERLMYANKPVMITAVNGNKFKVAQDCGLNDWNIFELMGEEVVNEEQGASDTGGVC